MKANSKRMMWIALTGVAMSACGLASAADVILNEYNGVRSDRWLDCDEPPADPLCDTDAADSFFGRVEGNGGNWFEIVVITDHLDMTGWDLNWAQIPAEAGTLTLSNDPLWSDLRSGTIITFVESTTLEGGLDTDVSYDPAGGDWWININSFDAQYVTTVTNVVGDGPGNFSVGNDDWQLTIADAADAVVFGPAGEGIPVTAPGVNSREIFKLEEDPSDSVDPVNSNWQDGTTSTFGSANVWSGGTMSQDFSALRSVVVPNTPVTLVLVPRLSASGSDTGITLPSSQTTFGLNSPFVIEVWVQTTQAAGLSSVSLDMVYDISILNVNGVTHTDLFDQLVNSSFDNLTGNVDDLSGSVDPAPCNAVAFNPVWGRVAILDVEGIALGTGDVSTADSGSLVYGTAVCGVGDVDSADIDHDTITLEIDLGVEPCTTIEDCADVLPVDGIRDDNCVWWECTDGGLCVGVDVVYADMGGQFGLCPPDGTADGNDRFHALNCFSNVDPDLPPPSDYPCEAAAPTAFNVDAGGQFGSCNPDGVCDGNDAFAALNAFGNMTTCSCPLNPSPEFGGGQGTVVVGQSGLTLVARQDTARPGDLIDVDVYLDDAVKDLRGYQLHLGTIGGTRGGLDLIDIYVAADTSAVFDGLATWSAFNIKTSQMVVGMDDAGVSIPGGYLATFTYRASKDAQGAFVIDVLYDDPAGLNRTFLFPTPSGSKIAVAGTTAAEVVVGTDRKQRTRR